jgi:uncharacterized protein YxjI
MSERILMMPDKMIRSGHAPVYDERDEEIATIYYQYFSFNRKLEVRDIHGALVSKGNAKAFSFRPTWVMYNQYGDENGRIKQLFTLFTHNFVYIDAQNREYKIDGNMRGRNFTIQRDGDVLLKVDSKSPFFTFRPHSYMVTILDENFNQYEAISLVEGIRTLVEMAKSRN